MKGFLDEFKKFIMRGNVLDMAVGVIIGGAFTAIVTSLNKDIITPLLALFGGVDFSYLTLVMGSGEYAPVLLYGNFITAVINFLITAFVILCLIKAINVLGKKFVKKEETPVDTMVVVSEWPYLLRAMATTKKQGDMNGIKVLPLPAEGFKYDKKCF